MMYKNAGNMVLETLGERFHTFQKFYPQPHSYNSELFFRDANLVIPNSHHLHTLNTCIWEET